MKKNFLFLPFLFLTLFSFSKPSLYQANAALQPVLDTDGEKLRVGASYYILPAARGAGRGGGLGWIPRCYDCEEPRPNSVVQVPHAFDNGLPITFTPFNSKKGFVHVSTDLNIKFSGDPYVWLLENYDQPNSWDFIRTSGVAGYPGIGTVTNWLKIEKYNGAYKLYFCPSVCKTCKIDCRDVSIHKLNGTRFLAVYDPAHVVPPFELVFKKA